MKLKEITIGEKSFALGSTNIESLKNAFEEKFGRIIGKGNPLSFIIGEGFRVISGLSDKELDFNQQIILTCLKVTTKIDFILDEAEASFDLEAQISRLRPEDMLDLINDCHKKEEFDMSVQSILSEYKRESDFQDACQIFSQLDFTHPKKDNLEMICALLREFNFNGELIAILESKKDLNIKIIRNQTYPEDKNIVIQIHGDTKTPTFYLEGQVLLKMKEIETCGDTHSKKRYFKGISFGGKSGIIITHDDIVFNQALDSIKDINGQEIIIIKDVFGGGYHLYFPKKNKIIHLHAVIIGLYYRDINGMKIDEDDEDFEEKIQRKGVKKLLRLIVDAEKGFFYDFDGEDFGELKIQTENMILGHPAKSNLH